MTERLTLPVLPLREVVLFPGVTAPIGAGRPATLRAIESALATPDKLVFAVSQRTNTDTVSPETLYTIGTVARIGQLQRGLGGVQLLLHGEGCDVHAFASTQPALAGIGSWLPTHAVIDYRLPDGDGIEALGKLRAQGWTGPAVLITAFASEELRQRADVAGFATVLAKPFADSRLIETMRQ